MFGEYLRRQNEIKEKERAEWEREYKRYSTTYQSPIFDFTDIYEYYINILSSLLNKRSSIPTEAFSILNLLHTASIDDVKSRYRELSFIHHPDKGGSNIEFIKITEAKNKCVMYITSNSKFKAQA